MIHFVCSSTLKLGVEKEEREIERSDLAKTVTLGSPYNIIYWLILGDRGLNIGNKPKLAATSTTSGLIGHEVYEDLRQPVVHHCEVLTTLLRVFLRYQLRAWSITGEKN